MKKYLLAFLSLSFLTLSLFAAIPEGYYSTIDGKTGDAICEALFNKISSHTSLGYDNLYSMYQTSDMTAQGYIWDMYSTCNFSNPGDKCGSYKRVCDCFNREHSVPASWFGDANPMYCDPFHVIPTDGYVNNQRSNYALGECANGERLSGGSLCKLGSSTFEGYTGVGKVFEVDDQYKGDFARAYFYMVTCYRNKNFTQAGGGSTMFTWSNSKAGFTAYTIALMLKWHRLDPVSEKEVRRNDAIYARQGNRNPFIDYPCLAEYIWGEYKTDQLDLASLMPSSHVDFFTSDRTGCNCQPTTPTITSPKEGVVVSLGGASVGESVSTSLTVMGALLTQPLTLTLSGTAAQYYTLSTNTLAAADVNNGTSVQITYTPTATGTHLAKLTISSSEIATPRTVTLTAFSKAELLTPTTGQDFVFVTEGVKSSVSQTIRVKATNLSSGIYVGIASSGTQQFAVTPTSLTAKQANDGADITVTYTPNSIGSHKTNLILNSLGKEFTQPTLTLSGTCHFAVQQASDITASSARLSWVDAGVNKYKVDVFFLERQEDPEVTILNSVAGDGASAKSGTYTDTPGYIRLGSGSTLGVLTYTGLDLSKQSTLTLTARAYKTDTDVKVKVSVNSKDTTLSLTSADADYVIPISAGQSSTSTVKLQSVDKGKRVLIKTVKITQGGTKEIRTSIAGYPREETYLFHVVSGLNPDTEYKYAITPAGLAESDILSFTTQAGTGTTTPCILHSASCTKTLTPDGHLLLHVGPHTYTATGTELY